MATSKIESASLASDAVDNTNLNSTLITAQTEKTTLVDADKFLISDSAASGALKYVQKSNLGAGGFTKIHSITASNSANVAFDNTYITSSYKTYFIIADGVNSASDAVEFQLWLSTDNGSSFLGGISRVHLSMEDDDAGITVDANDEGAGACIIGKSSQGNATGEQLSATIWIFGSQDSNSWINVNAQAVSWGNSMELTWENSSHGARSTSNLNYIKLQHNTGNISSGVFTLYGAN